MELRDFEKAMRRLEEVVKELESGDAGLEKCLELFEEGMSLSKELQQLLTSAQAKVEQLLGEAPPSDEGSESDGTAVEDAAPDAGTGA